MPLKSFFVCFSVLISQAILFAQTEPFVIEVCDDNFDGITQVNFEEIRNQLNSQVDTGENPLDEVYIANSYNGLIKIENVSTNPNRVNVCNSSFSLYEVAIDEDQQIYVSGQSGIFLVDTDNCTYQNVGTLPPQSNVAMSFDTQNNLYAGGFRHSRVYRADAGQFDDFYVWHDFGDGSSGGDFVVIGEFMYIAWAYNDDYYMFKVTMDADNQYVSHENMGSIPTDTFGLAAENGRLYGVTPDYLYEINLETLATSQIIVNSTSTPWWGAAGLHEAVAFEITFHDSLENAQTGSNDIGLDYTNTVPFQQEIFIRVLNENTGEFEIYPLIINVTVPEETNTGNLYACVPEGQNTAAFTLSDALPQMIDDTVGLNISYYTTQQNAQNGTSPITNIQNYQPQSLPATVYVRFENPCVSINTITLSGDRATLSLPESISFCEGESAVIQVNEIFDNYTWSGLTGEDLNNNDINSNQITVTNPGTYTVTVEYGEGCSVSRNIQVTQDTLPVFTAQTAAFCAEGNQLEVSSAELIAELTNANATYHYELYRSAADADSGNNVVSGNVNVSNGQILTVKVKNNSNSGCYILEELQIQLNPYPEIALDEIFQICEGENVEIALPPGFVSYQWIGLQGSDVENNDAQSSQISITQSGTYTVSVSNEFCTVTREFTVNYDEAAVISSVEIEGNTATVMASGPGNLQYSTDGITWYNSPVFQNLESGAYTAYVRGDEVCGITERDFALFEITNVITPNGDGLNDVWEIKGISAYPEARLQIFNRYGKLLVDENTGSDVVWDGKYKGQPVPSGGYWYRIIIDETRQYSGHITVKNF